MIGRDVVKGAVTLLSLAAGVARAETDILEIGGMTFVSSRDSINELVLWAESARVDTEAEAVDLEQIHVSVSEAEHRLGLSLRCRRGRLDLLTNDFRLEGDVTGRTSDGRRFAAEWVEYSEAEGLLFTDAPVVIRDGDEVYRGGGLRYHIGERRLRLLSGSSVVRGR